MSSIPDADTVTAQPEWYKEPCCLGIDEAGRGPVLGAMVYGSAFCSIANKEYLAGQKYDDSKKLSEEKREHLFDQIKADSKVGYHVTIISAEELSAKMCRREKYNLNAISHDAAIALIQRALDEGVNVKEVFVDTVGIASTYEEKLGRIFPDIKFKVAPKADSLYPIVSAASIAAKVTRDLNLRDFQFKENITTTRAFGSGYPGDEVTKAWLEQHFDTVFGFPKIARFSWATTRNKCEKDGVPALWEADAEDDAATGNSHSNTKLTFGGKRAVAMAFTRSAAPGRHSYFKSRKLEHVAAF